MAPVEMFVDKDVSFVPFLCLFLYSIFQVNGLLLMSLLFLYC